MKKDSYYYFRLIHRYLGFYLVGIIAVYAISGITLIFRKGNTFKKSVTENVQLAPQLEIESLANQLKINDLNINNVGLYVITFNSPNQVKTLIKSMNQYDKDFVEKPQWILLDNSTDLETTPEYKKLCKEHDIIHVKKDN